MRSNIKLGSEKRISNIENINPIPRSLIRPIYTPNLELRYVFKHKITHGIRLIKLRQRLKPKSRNQMH